MTETGLVAGTILGDDFEIVRPLASGGMGPVFVAKQRRLNRPRAVKTMNVGLTANASLRARFEREARIRASIDSDHVVQIIQTGVDSHLGLPYIAMELLDGLPFSEYVEKNASLVSKLSIRWTSFDLDDGDEGTGPVGSFAMGNSCATGEHCGEYVVRGSGCHTERTDNVTMTTRTLKKQDFKSTNIGFRCAVSNRESMRI